MKRILLALLALAVATAFAVPAFAQSDATIVDGVVVEVTSSATGELETFAIVDRDGVTVNYSVVAEPNPTEFGLENQAGDRWVGNQRSEPVEASRRLRDHQRRFTAITVTSVGGVASSVVDKESGKLETNLNYLFALYTVTWAAFFAYIFILSRRQRDLQRQIARLDSVVPSDKGGKTR